MSKKAIKKPFRKEQLLEVRDEIIIMLADLGYGPTEIGFIINKSKQLVSYVLVRGDWKRHLIKNK